MGARHLEMVVPELVHRLGDGVEFLKRVAGSPGGQVRAAKAVAGERVVRGTYDDRLKVLDRIVDTVERELGMRQEVARYRRVRRHLDERTERQGRLFGLLGPDVEATQSHHDGGRPRLAREPLEILDRFGELALCGVEPAYG